MRRRVQWDAVTVHESCALDSRVVTQLDEGCEVWVVESCVLESGRERCRLERPVLGWVSAMFLTAEEKRRPSWKDGPLSEGVISMIGGREGNSRCFECGGGLVGLVSADGESAWADSHRGVVLCFDCAAGKDALHLRLDAFRRHHARAMLTGGNDQLRDFTRKRREENCLDEYKATLAAEAGAPSGRDSRRERVVATSEGERRASVVGRFYLVETHGGRAAIRDTNDPELRVGDYVVGVDHERVWKFHDVVAALETRNSERQPLSLLVKRIDILDHPLYFKAREDENWTAPPEEAGIVASGSPSSSFAGHAAVTGYWQQQQQEQEEEVAKAESPPRLVPRELAVLSLGPRAPLEFEVKKRDAGSFVAAVIYDAERGPLHKAIVVGVNERRRRFEHDDFLNALNTLRRPLLILLALEIY